MTSEEMARNIYSEHSVQLCSINTPCTNYVYLYFNFNFFSVKKCSTSKKQRYKKQRGAFNLIFPVLYFARSLLFHSLCH